MQNRGVGVEALTFQQLQLHGLPHVQPFQPGRFIDREEPLQSSQTRRPHGLNSAVHHPEAGMQAEEPCGPVPNVVPTIVGRCHVSSAGRGSFVIVLRGKT